MKLASTPSIIVHGGAFNIPDSYVKRYNEGTKRAARAGYDCLLQVKLLRNIFCNF